MFQSVSLAAKGNVQTVVVGVFNDKKLDRATAAIDAKLGRFSGRITRDQWVAQAKLLAAGEESAFAAQFGRNG